MDWCPKIVDEREGVRREAVSVRSLVGHGLPCAPPAPSPSLILLYAIFPSPALDPRASSSSPPPSCRNSARPVRELPSRFQRRWRPNDRASREVVQGWAPGRLVPSCFRSRRGRRLCGVFFGWGRVRVVKAKVCQSLIPRANPPVEVAKKLALGWTRRRINVSLACLLLLL